MRPLATSAVSTADGPGSTVTWTPASSAAPISRAPGSLIPGSPASETSAYDSPARRRGSSSATRFASLCSWYDISRAWIPCRCRSPAVWRVSSQRTKSTSSSTRSTRSVTSSRLPIGVAQTKSGNLLKSLERDQPGADQAGHRAELGGDDPQLLVERRERVSLRDLECAVDQERKCGPAEAAADHDEPCAERVRQRPGSRAEPTPDSGQDLECPSVAFLGEPDEPVRIHGRTERFLRELRRSFAGHVRLEVT